MSEKVPSWSAAHKTVAVVAVLLLGGVLAWNRVHAAGGVVLPDPAVTSASGKGLQKAVLAGGCFWGVEAVFEHVKGVSRVTSGYSGGSPATAHYPLVSTGTTGQAESVEITFDPSQVSYAQLLKVFFSVAHDPTQLDRQGPDMGSQYRSAIFYLNDDQKKVAEAYIDQLRQAKVYSSPIVTQVVPSDAFYPAEAYHQDYAAHHPHNPYIVVNDAPKVSHLRERFPELYREG